jgi:hypothetical protein
MNMLSKHSVIIGRAEYVDIKDVVLNVPAKIDTGAFRSSVHCSDVFVSEKDGKPVLKVKLLGHPVSPVIYDLVFEEYEEVEVTNSFGHAEKRFEVKLKLKIGSKVFTTSCTLADRRNNLFPVLIGREALRKRFVVDVSQSSVDRVKLKKEYGIKHPLDREDLEE